MELNIEIRSEIKQAIEEMGFNAFTEIQELTIPLLLAGKDIIGHSHTGTGKTAAFGIPILERLDFVIYILLVPNGSLLVRWCLGW